MELLLKKGELLNLGKSAHKSRILCTAGTCWLTCQGLPGDHLLHIGQALQIDSRGTLLLIALHDCRIEIQVAIGEVIRPQLCHACEKRQPSIRWLGSYLPDAVAIVR